MRSAVQAAVLAAITWAAADVASGRSHSSAWINVWNTSARLVVFLVVVKLLISLRDSREVQEKLARCDWLTGVANSRTFEESAIDVMATAERTRQPFTVAYIDLDDFKAINDTLGHSGGDDVLRAVGRALTDSTRATDLVARVGGDEFALLLPATDSEGAARLMNDLVPRALEELRNVPLPVTFSAGAATFLVPPRDIDLMVRTADELMYGAKRTRKGSFRHVVVGLGDERAVPDTAPRRTSRTTSFA